MSSFAQPYARALFDLARESDSADWAKQFGRGEERAGTLSVVERQRMSDEILDHWQAQLDLLALIAEDADFAALAANPRVSGAQLQDFMIEVAGARLSAQGANLVKLLVRNGRTGELPAIARIYAALRAEAMQVVTVRITTAAEADARQRKQFTSALQAKLGGKAALEFAVDPELIGGAVVRIGDSVLDASVRAGLRQLASAISA